MVVIHNTKGRIVAVTETFKSKDGGIIHKVDAVNGTVLVEGFINSNNDLEYTKYHSDDGGIVDLKTVDMNTTHIHKLFVKTLAELVYSENTYT